MAICPKCGASVDGKFCAKCGTAISAASPGANPANFSAAGSAASYSQLAAGGLTENVAGALCYVLGLISGIVFLVLAPYNQNKNVRFHAFQAILFHVAFVAVIIAETIVAMILPWALSAMISLLSMVVWLGALVLWVLLIVKAYQGERFKLPVIGDLAEKHA